VSATRPSGKSSSRDEPLFQSVWKCAPNQPCCHTFRATGITTYLQNGGTLEHAQTIANHESPRTTKLYDRTREELSFEEVERIKI